MTTRNIQTDSSSLTRGAAGTLPRSVAVTALRAWIVSLALHAVVLAPLVFIHTSSSAPAAIAPSVTPAATVAPARNSMSRSTVVPKPKVAGPAAISADNEIPKLSGHPERLSGDSESLKPISRGERADSGQTPVTGARYVAPQVEFFGSRLDGRKVCFVVDASGSMLGLFSTVRSHLIRSVQSLQPDQYFSIIFFNDRLRESSPGSLVRATSSAKSSATAFIGGAQPAGPTDPVAALRQAMLARDPSGEAPTLIYFLTDGFDLAPRDADTLPAQIRALRKQLAPAVKINTIGFWTQPYDCVVLQKIAQQSGGDFVSVNE